MNEHKGFFVEGSKKNPEGMDAGKLKQILGGADHTKVRQRRNLYIRLYHEASVLCPPGKGMSFTDMLLLLAHYKLINDHEALE
jgi:voltage-dependent calcium channel